jgi:hypothetical protein
MKQIALKSGQARDKWIIGDQTLAVFELYGGVVSISIGAECPENERNVFEATSHTVFELENLAEGLTFVALSGLPYRFEVLSKDTLLGPVVHLWPALRLPLGDSEIYCSLRKHPLAKRDFVDIQVGFGSRAGYASFEVDDILTYSQMFYDWAKSIAAEADWNRPADRPQGE